jgi:hypothetical protein
MEKHQRILLNQKSQATTEKLTITYITDKTLIL